MKGKQVTLAHAQQLFAQERETVLVSISSASSAVIVFLLHQLFAVPSLMVAVCLVMALF